MSAMGGKSRTGIYLGCQVLQLSFLVVSWRCQWNTSERGCPTGGLDNVFFAPFSMTSAITDSNKKSYELN